MKLQKLFSSLLLGALLSLAAIGAEAQTGGPTGYKKCIEPAATSAHTQPAAERAAEVRSDAQLEFSQGGILDALERQKKAVVGSWQITLGCGCQILASFTSDGIFIE